MKGFWHSFGTVEAMERRNRWKGKRTTLLFSKSELVGAARFELTTPCAQGRCATRLRYAPTCKALLILNHFSIVHPFHNSFPASKRIKTVSKPQFTVPAPYQNPSPRWSAG